jgi:hypothetical protein
MPQSRLSPSDDDFIMKMRKAEYSVGLNMIV